MILMIVVIGLFLVVAVIVFLGMYYSGDTDDKP